MSLSSMAEPEQPTEPEPEPTGANSTVAFDAELDAILNRIAPATESGHKKLRGMIFSDPGEGKTTLIGGIPNNLILDTEEGTNVLVNTAPNVDVIPFKSFYQAQVIVDRLGQNVPQLAKYETFSMDTISFLHKKGLAEVTEREWAKAPSAVNQFVAETEHHTENNEHMRRLVAAAIQLDRNLILTCHARTVQKKGEIEKTYPDFSEKLANTINGMLDFVGYLYTTEIDGEEHKVLKLRQGTSGIVCKTRITTMPENLIDPTWDKIWDLFQEHNASKKTVS